MVWGMVDPSSIGDYFPIGDYIGWREQLISYFNESMPEEQRALFDYENKDRASNYAYYVHLKFKNERGKKFMHPPPLGPIKPHEPPKCFATEKTYSSLASLIKLNDLILAVDETLKDIVERFEPGLHQFFPITILLPMEKIYPKNYYVMVIGQYLDSFTPEQSEAGSWKVNSAGNYSVFDESKKSLIGLAFANNIFGKAHLWRERHMYNPSLLLSDALHAEITNAGLRMPRFYQMKVV